MSTGKSRAAAVVPVSAVTGGKPIALAAMRTQQQTLKMVPIAPATTAIHTVEMIDLLYIVFANI
jgi:hypothetical protein